MSRVNPQVFTAIDGKERHRWLGLGWFLGQLGKHQTGDH
jgi:hypothetical protein